MFLLCSEVQNTLEYFTRDRGCHHSRLYTHDIVRFILSMVHPSVHVFEAVSRDFRVIETTPPRVGVK